MPDPKEIAIYRCPHCRPGIVFRKTMPFKTKVRNIEIDIPDAVIGICNKCGKKTFNAKELKRWEKILDDRVKEIAAGLTEAQRKAILETEYSYSGHFNRWAVVKQTVRALARRELVIDCENGWFKLTDLGLAVKAVLEGENNET
jgi:hypothetical protein